MKRPKPVFTDSRKLDNSRDWEQVKIPKPSLEDMSGQSLRISSDVPPTTSTSKSLQMVPTNLVAEMQSKSFNTRKEMIRKELNGLQHDIEQTKHLQGIECFLGQCAPYYHIINSYIFSRKSNDIYFIIYNQNRMAQIWISAR